MRHPIHRNHTKQPRSVREGGPTNHVGLCGPPNEDQAPCAPAPAQASQPQEDDGKSISGFPPCFLGGLYSRRLLGAPGIPPPPPRVSQRPPRPNRVHSLPPAHVQDLSVRQESQCDRGDHTAVSTAASGAVVGDGDADDNTFASVGGAISQPVAAEKMDNVLGKVTVAREQYALRQHQLPAWQSTMVPVVRESVVCVRGAEGARVRRWLEPQVLRGLILALVGLQTALGRASAAPPGKKVMSIVGQEIVGHAEDLRLGGWQVPTVYQTWCILVAKMEWALGVLAYTASAHLN
ncbi:hypothetical protein PC128_g11792 [Phytophthora cactorum]|nr:hypothetical protein PC128_g11792 [Phytophthora cactorum]